MTTKIIINENILKSEYKRLKSIEKVANFFDVSASTIKKLFKEHNINFANTNKLMINDNFFSFDTKESFYIAGFIAADGCVHNKRALSIRLSSNDKKHLENMNMLMGSARKIRDYANDYSGVSVLRITSKQIVSDLADKFNIVPRKSLIYKFPEYVKEHPLCSHFMRGYSDGDGCFYVQRQTKTKICFSVRGTQSFLLDYRNILEKECNFPHREYDIPISNNCGVLSYGGNKNIQKISIFLYNNATIFLERKRNIALQATNLMGSFYV